MEFASHLSFNGNCEEAFKFYEKLFGGKILTMMTYGGSPMADQAEPAWKEKILHASLTVGAQMLMGADAPKNLYRKPQGIFVSISVDSASEAERLYKALTEKAEVVMPLQETFWAARFGMLVDRFGIPWMINCGKPQ